MSSTTTEAIHPAPVTTPAVPAGAKHSTQPVTTPEHRFKPYRMTVDRYYRMIEAGIFGPKDPVFLWRGVLVQKMTKNQPHNIAVTELNTILCRLVPAGWHVRPEQPVLLEDGSVPEPDISIVRGASRDYPQRPPTPNAVALIVEVAESSLPYDSGDVRQTYAAAGIPVYWLWNLVDRRLQVYTDPTGPDSTPDYRHRRDYGPDEEVPVILDGREVGRIAVRDVLP